MHLHSTLQHLPLIFMFPLQTRDTSRDNFTASSILKLLLLKRSYLILLFIFLYVNTKNSERIFRRSSIIGNGTLILLQKVARYTSQNIKCLYPIAVRSLPDCTPPLNMYIGIIRISKLDSYYICSTDISDWRYVWCLTPTRMITLNYFHFLKLLQMSICQCCIRCTYVSASYRNTSQ